MCPLCIGVGVLTGVSAAAGYVSDFLGWDAPKTTKGKVASSFLTGLTTAITLVAIKTLSNAPICGGISQSLLYRLTVSLAKSLPIALISGVAWNSIIAKFEKSGGGSPGRCCSAPEPFNSSSSNQIRQDQPEN